MAEISRSHDAGINSNGPAEEDTRIREEESLLAFGIPCERRRIVGPLTPCFFDEDGNVVDVALDVTR